jgi:hypothetical protein
VSILRAVIGGYFAAALLSNIVMGWYGVSDFEGGRGMATAFLFGRWAAAKPDPGQGWGAWRAVDFVSLPGQPQTVKPGPGDPFELRHRVRVWGSE